jgi:hypothetical protein
MISMILIFSELSALSRQLSAKSDRDDAGESLEFTDS